MSPHCLEIESMGCQFDPAFLYLSPLLFFYLVLSLFLSYPFLLLVHSLDFFPLNLHFPRHFCVALVLFFERLGDVYFSWWYVQHI